MLCIQKINIIIVISFIVISTNVLAVNPEIPSSAETSRFLADENSSLNQPDIEQPLIIPYSSYKEPIPDSTKSIIINLKQINIEGLSVFPKKNLEALYNSYLNKKVSLSVIWQIAQDITNYCREKGYFLSQAYLPQQVVKNGVITIQISEGYISKIEMPDDLKNSKIANHYIKDILNTKFITINKLESALLKLNDMPGYSFRALVEPLRHVEDKLHEGAVLLRLMPISDKESKKLISLDNYLSRFLGPQKVSASYSASLFKMQQTKVNIISSIPTKKLMYGSFSHDMLIAPNSSIIIQGSKTHTNLGYTLAPLDITGDAKSASIGFKYQLIRQRAKNLYFKIALDAINTANYIMSSTFTNDHIRALRFSTNYDFSDNWKGYNTALITLSQGIKAFDASNANAMFTSNMGAKPNFSKINYLISRNQKIVGNWSAVFSSSGQFSSLPLYSYEQFGYGGQAFGKAYDSSEIVGDQGISGSLELNYADLGNFQKIKLEPFCFYDIGKVWAKQNANHLAYSQSAASTGLGIRFTTKKEIAGEISLAWPLIKNILTPIYGGNNWGPRISFQISKKF
jgi:hemolysin activation/secretion protein